MRRFIILALVAVLGALGAVSLAAAAGGFDDAGYNRTARIFNGTGMSWCMEKFDDNQSFCTSYLGAYANDKLVMKWNAEWDRGNAEGWNDPNGYAAWTSNQWNGLVPDGSGSVWQYRIVWIGGNCGANGTPLPDGGYCIWGQFETIMDHGLDPAWGEGHMWFAHATPSGYGSYYP